jgi:hypothetical protein
LIWVLFCIWFGCGFGWIWFLVLYLVWVGFGLIWILFCIWFGFLFWFDLVFSFGFGLIWFLVLYLVWSGLV